MRQAMILVLVIFLLSCAVSAQTDSFPVGGQMRSYIVHAPSGLSNPPLVISMHGMGGTGSQQQMMTGFNKIADTAKFVVVYPNGRSNTWDISGDTDVTFLSALIDTMNVRYGIDRNRVYATGFSMGGFMSYKLACKAADKFAAVGPVSGTTITYNCSPSRPVPVIHIHGTADTVVKYSGVAATISFWVNKDGCPQTPQTTKPYPASNPNSKVTKDYYGPCNQSSEIILLSVEGMGHAYPGSFGSTDINASEEIWAFFKNHSLSQSGISRDASNELVRRGISVHSFAGKIRLQSEQKLQAIRVFDIQGKLIFTWNAGESSVRSVALPTDRLQNGMYVLSILGVADHATFRVAVP